jgi:hypothetical protein
MPSLEQVKAFRKDLFDESMALIDKKGADYNREQQLAGDTLFNLRVAEILGIVPTAERGILVRLSDKFMRLISLMQQGVDPAVKGESVRDTVRDIHNYIDYALVIFEERRNPTTAGPKAASVLKSAGVLKATDPYPDRDLPAQRAHEWVDRHAK